MELSPIMRLLTLVGAALLLATSCQASTDESQAGATSTEVDEAPLLTTEATTMSTQNEPTGDAASVPTASGSTVSGSTVSGSTVSGSTLSGATTTDADEPASSCVRLTDFEGEEQQRAWFIVNDNVMGGRSDGAIDFGESEIRFFGSINTDGGGFASTRAALDPGVLSNGEYLVVRARGDNRPYRFTLSDELEGRDPRISHQGLIELDSKDGWQEVWVPLSELSASLFGRSVDTPPFDRGTANEIGIILSDSVDGPFSLEVDWIDVCS